MNLARKLVVTATLAAMYMPISAYATNGMNLEGYGPVSLGMGGAGMAFDNGSAAMMNNPATVGLMPNGSRADVAVGFLGPDVSAHHHPSESDADSSADAFWMPALGWVRKHNGITLGIGVFAQGGMGTEYAGDSFMAAGSGEKVRSEVGVGRLMIPFAFDINPSLVFGGSVDLVWAGMDIKMALSGPQFGDMVATLGGTQSAGSASGSMVDGLVMNIGTLLNDGTGAGAGFGTGPINWARFDFSDDSSFTGEAFATGYAGKLGAVLKITPQVTMGFTYHSKTALGDLESSNATMSMSANVDTGLAVGGPASGTYAAQTIELTGKVKVVDFEWPAMFGIGAAFQPTPDLTIATEIKRIMWADAMKSFKMTFTADATQSGLAQGFAGSEVDTKLLQKWEDQHVAVLGAAYRVTPEATLRVGYNRATNPIPDMYLNPLFPAIVESHVTAGVGYAISSAASVDFALSYALERTATNPGSDVESAMSQVNWQLMYSHRY